MRIKPPARLLLGLLLWLSGCGPARVPASDAPRPPGSIPTPPDAPAEPTFKLDVPPRFIRHDPPIQPTKARKPLARAVWAAPPGRVRPARGGGG